MIWAFMWSPTDGSNIIPAEKVGENFAKKGEVIKVPYVDLLEVRKLVGHDMCDGSFNGCYNQAYVLTDEQKEWIIAANEEQAKQAEREKLVKDVEYYKKLLSSITNVYTQEEAETKLNEYNRKYNEDGYGYVPHYYTHEEYAEIKSKLEKLSAKLLND